MMENTQKIDTETIKKLIEEHDWRTLKEYTLLMSPQDTADLFEDLDEFELGILFRLIPRDQAADIFVELDTDQQEHIVQQISSRRLTEIINELSADDRTEIFEELPGKITQRLINMLPPTERQMSMELLGYPPDSVGKLMTPEYVAVRSFWTIERALEHIRYHGRDAETIDRIYIIDDDWHLLDDLSLRKLIVNDPENLVENIMDYQFISIYATDDQEEAVRKIKKYDMVALPVIDSDGVLMGIVTIDDLIDILEEESSEDFQKISAVSPLEMSYDSASSMDLYKKRVGWLLLLVVANFFSSGVIAYFENVLEAVVVLAFFIPVLIGSGGNTATQSATLIIRAVSIGELNINKWFSVIKKEIITGSMLGLSLGLVIFLYIMFWQESVRVGAVVGLSLIAIVLWANILGSVIPLILTKLRLDPAIVSSPLLTTIVDATGLAIYFIIATYLLGL
jgi:magnesium transporter